MSESTTQNFQFSSKNPVFIRTKLHKDRGEDQTNPLYNVGSGRIRPNTNLQIGEMLPSAWTQYPDHYKFIGIEVHMADQVIVLNRSTKDLFYFIGDFGGISEFFLVAIGLFLAPISRMTLSS